MAVQTAGVSEQMNTVTIPKYARMYIKSLISAYKGRQLIITIISSVVVGALGVLVTAFVFPHFFSVSSMRNQLFSGLAFPIILMTAVGIVMSAVKQKSAYFRELGSSTASAVRTYYSRKTALKDRIWLIAMTVVGAAAAFENARFMLILSVCLFFSAVKGNEGNLLSVTAAFQNSFNNVFRKNHIRKPENTRVDLFGIAFGMFLTALILVLIRTISGAVRI